MVDASAAEVEGKTYTTIQDAINYIYNLYSSETVTYTYKIYTGQNESDLDEIQNSWYLQAKYGSSPTTYSYKAYPEEMSGWTINIESGTYLQFSVYEGLDGLTIQAADGADVVITTWTGEENSNLVTTSKLSSIARAYQIFIASRNLTFDGLTFTIGDYVDSTEWWAKSAITDVGGGTGVDTTGLKVTNCDFQNVGSQGYYTVYSTGTLNQTSGIITGTAEGMTITNCSFDGLAMAIGVMCDSMVVNDDGVIITDNTFTSCDFIFSCYYGGNKDLSEVTDDDIGGNIVFSNNTVEGTSELRSKISILDQGVKGSIGNVTVSGNNFSYAMIVVENMDESPCTVNDVLEENTWSNGSFYVDVDAYYWDDCYQGTLTASIPDYVYYESPKSDSGYWVLNVDLENYSSSTNTEYVQSLIDEANAEGSHTLSITYDAEGALVDTITALKDCIYWVSFETTDIVVTKEWDDANNQDGKRPESIIVELYKNGSATGTTITLSKTNNWTGTFENLPTEYYVGGGNNLTAACVYEVKEVSTLPEGYSYEVDGSANEGFIITNSYDPETTEYTVTKIWDDDENRDGVRPETIEVMLSGSDGSEYTAELAESNEWQYTFTDLPVYWNEGQAITYTVEELTVEGYSVTVTDANEENEFTITNTHEIETVDIPVEKIWDDNDDQDGVRKDSITVTLTGSDGTVREGTLTSENNWKYTFTDLPVYFNEGTLITYSLQEAAVDSYTDEVVAGDNGYSFTVTNNHIPAVTDVTVTKVWDDAGNQDGIKPDSVKVTLTGSDGNTYEATLTEENGYAYLFSSLPVYYNHGTLITYSVEEEFVTGYDSSCTVDDTGYAFTITNTHKPETISIPVTKVWDDNDDQDGIRPESITVTLTGSNGSVYEAVLNADNNWAYVFEDVSVYYNEGQTVEYTLSETDTEGYSVTMTGSANTDGFTVTNTHEPETTEIVVTKLWEDDDDRDGLRTDTIDVTLSGSDGKTYQTSLSESTGWAATIIDLPVYYNHGEKVVYSILESELAGYTLDSLTGADGYSFTLTNTHEITVTEVTVEKVWDDAENQDGMRTESIEVVLTGTDGSSYTAELTADTGWTYTFQDLPVYFDAGQVITYSLQETTVDGYTGTVTVSADRYSFTVTNTHTPAVTDVVVAKVWDDSDNQDGCRPNSVTVTLTGTDGSAYTAELTAENSYTYQFSNLPVYYDEGKLIEYNVTEADVEGYTASTVADDTGYSFTITNVHTPETTSISVTKVWDDNDDQDGIRPDSIAVTLSGSNGMVYMAELSAENNWVYTFENLYTYWNEGVVVEYTLEEIAVDGYESVVTQTKDGTGFTISNTHTPEIYTIDEDDTDGDSTDDGDSTPNDDSDSSGDSDELISESDDADSGSTDKNGSGSSTSNNSNSGSSPNTGDSSRLILWVALLVVAVAAVIIIIVKRKKR